ncbi:MAG: ATP/GTP-binding protein, partial [Candidatus Thermoplasmatota archaeon]|nr:ATP/GTP-binding protein [Candidatus Thermoplasmatota archaeon]
MIGSLFVTGPAGTGKSSFSGALKEWFVESGYDVALVNLDPGAEYIPYDADYDIREMISLNDVMSQYNLGPNGAQIVASDLITENSDAIIKELSVFEDYYVIFDTPGQIELFAFRPSSPILIDQLTGGKSMLAFITDSVLSTSP